ncbi:hypothetical protein HYW46_06235 [Candidatus Daviesbacteria bacterium]|nr:hypothetical protein [Candidatus Daviesbacteria bacterium]
MIEINRERLETLEQKEIRSLRSLLDAHYEHPVDPEKFEVLFKEWDKVSHELYMELASQSRGLDYLMSCYEIVKTVNTERPKITYPQQEPGVDY